MFPVPETLIRSAFHGCGILVSCIQHSLFIPPACRRPPLIACRPLVARCPAAALPVACRLLLAVREPHWGGVPGSRISDADPGYRALGPRPWIQHIAPQILQSESRIHDLGAVYIVMNPLCPCPATVWIFCNLPKIGSRDYSQRRRRSIGKIHKTPKDQNTDPF